MTYIANKSIVKHRILNTILLESIFGNYFYILAQFMKNPDIRYSRPGYKITWNYYTYPVYLVNSVLLWWISHKMYRLLDHSWSPRIQKGHLVTCFGMDNSQNLYIGHARANTNVIRIIFVHIVVPSAVYTMSRFSRNDGKSSCGITDICDDVTSRDEGHKIFKPNFPAI